MLLTGIARGFGGSVLFTLPLLMTMEMWWLGVAAPRERLMLLVVAAIACAVVLSYYFGFLHDTSVGVAEAAVDAGIAVLIGIVASAAVLTALAVVRPFEDWRSAVSVVAVEALPATVGASFARSQLGEDRGVQAPGPAGPVRELTVLAVGAAVFCASIAPTQEVPLLAARMDEWHAIVLVALSLALAHGFVYGSRFAGGRPGERFVESFLLHTVPGYVVAVLVSAYLLWTFDRFDGLDAHPALLMVLVLALPASVGAAAARLIL